MAERIPHVRSASHAEYEWRTTYAHNALRERLGPELYDQARSRSTGTYWSQWLEEMWRMIDERGLTAEAERLVTAANRAGGFWDGKQHCRHRLTAVDDG